HYALYSFFFSSRRRHTRSKRDWSSDVCSSDLDRGAPLRSCPPHGEGSVVVRMGDVPAVAVFHPASPEREAPIVLASDDEIAAGGFVAVMEFDAVYGDVALEDPVSAGTGVKRGDRVEGFRDQHRALPRRQVCAPGLVGGFEDLVIPARRDPLVRDVGIDDVRVADPQLQGRLLLPVVLEAT